MNNKNNPALKLIVTHLDRIESKVDKLDDRLDSSEKVQIKHEANLAEHMRRSEMLERSQKDLESVVKPVLKAYTITFGLVKLIVAVGTVIGFIASFIALIK